MKKANASRMAGIRKVWFFVMLLVSVSTGARAQFTIDNQSSCDWPLVLYCAGYGACKPLIQPPISITAPHNMITQVNLAAYYPWTNARVVGVDVYDFRHQSWVTIGDHLNCPTYSSSTQPLACPNSGQWYIATFNPITNSVTIN